MTSSTGGIFDVEQMNLIRDAHVAWCSSRSIDPTSPMAQDAVRIMIEAFRQGKRQAEELVSACDHFVTERQSHVRLGSPAIPSTSNDGTCLPPSSGRN